MSNRSALPKMLAFDTVSSFERVLAFSIGEEKSRECVERLLARYGSFYTVFSVSEEEICHIGGVNMNTALLIKLMAYVNSRRVLDKFEFGVRHSRIELEEYLKSLFLGVSVETVYVLLLDDSDRVIATEHINDGTVNASDVVPRKILEYARRRDSRKIILVHNHPRGNATPSKDDIMTTGRLFELFSSVGVRLCMHYIVADGEIEKIDTAMLYNADYGS